MTKIFGILDESQEPNIVELGDGTLYPLTATGAFTLRKLRLNRRPLVNHRLQHRRNVENSRLRGHYQDLAWTLDQLLRNHVILIKEQHQLLEFHRELLQILLNLQK